MHGWGRGATIERGWWERASASRGLVGEGGGEVFEEGVAGVLVAEDGLGGGDAPVDAKGVVEDADASVGLRMVELIALVLEDGSLAEYGEAMGEALRDEELTVVVFGEFNGNVLTVGRGAFANVNGYVQDGAFDTANEFALCEGGALEMQTTHHAVSGFAFIILDEDDLSDFFIEFPLREGFEEIAARIFKDTGLYDIKTFYFCFDYIHDRPRRGLSWFSL